jgi:hypothetical protein
MAAADNAVLTRVSDYVLDPEIVEGAIADAIRELRPSRDTVEAKRAALLADIKVLEDEQARYVAAIAVADEVDALARALQDRERQRSRLQHELAALDSLDRFSAFDVRQVARDLRKRLDEWRGLLRRQTPLSRQVLSRLVDGRIAWTPHKLLGACLKSRVRSSQRLSVTNSRMLATSRPENSDSRDTDDTGVVIVLILSGRATGRFRLRPFCTLRLQITATTGFSARSFDNCLSPFIDSTTLPDPVVGVLVKRGKRARS